MDIPSRHNVIKVKLLVLLNGAVKENKLTLCIMAPIYEGIWSLFKTVLFIKMAVGYQLCQLKYMPEMCPYIT